jgi:hypothetical protein
MSLSEVFNNLLKIICGLLVSVIVLIMFLRYNKYFVERREKLKIFFSHDVLCPSKILTIWISIVLQRLIIFYIGPRERHCSN